MVGSGEGWESVGKVVWQVLVCVVWGECGVVCECDLLQFRYLFVSHNGGVVRVAHVQQLTTQREYSVVVAADDRQA